MIKIKFFFIILFLLPSITQAEENFFKKSLLNLKNKLIIPNYEKTYLNVKELNKLSKYFCNSPSNKGLEELKKQWKKSFNSWQEIQFLRIGPINKDFRYESIQFWPDKNGIANKQYIKLIASKKQKKTTLENIKKGSVTLRGFPILEKILFKKNLKFDKFLNTEDGKYKCKLLINVSKDLELNFLNIITEWENLDDKKTILIFKEEGNNEKKIEKIYYKFYFNTTINYLQFVINYKLLAPLGKDGKRKLKKSESWRSKTSIKNIQSNFISLQKFFNLDQNTSFINYLKTINEKNLALKLDNTLKSLIVDTNNLDESFEKNINNNIEKLKLILEKIFLLNTLIEDDLSIILEIKKGFNAYDGD